MVTKHIVCPAYARAKRWCEKPEREQTGCGANLSERKISCVLQYFWHNRYMCIVFFTLKKQEQLAKQLQRACWKHDRVGWLKKTFCSRTHVNLRPPCNHITCLLPKFVPGMENICSQQTQSTWHSNHCKTHSIYTVLSAGHTIYLVTIAKTHFIQTVLLAVICWFCSK